MNVTGLSDLGIDADILQDDTALTPEVRTENVNQNITLFHL
jgi:hypothetical protein